MPDTCITSSGTALANSVSSVESDLGCTSRICFDHKTLTIYKVTLTSQKPYQHNNKYDCSKTNGINGVYVISITFRYIEKYINFIFSAD